MLVYACTPNIRDTESENQEFKAIVDYISSRPSLLSTNKETIEETNKYRKISSRKLEFKIKSVFKSSLYLSNIQNIT